MARNLEKLDLKFKSKKFTILHSENSINRQINVVTNKLPLLPPAIRASSELYLKDLRLLHF